MKRRWPWNQRATIAAALAATCAVACVVPTAPGPRLADQLAERVQVLVDAYDASFGWIDRSPVSAPLSSTLEAGAVIRDFGVLSARFDRAHARACRAADRREARLPQLPVLVDDRKPGERRARSTPEGSAEIDREVSTMPALTGRGLAPMFDELEAITGVLCDATQQLVADALASLGELDAARRAQLVACVDRLLGDARVDLARAEADLDAVPTRHARALVAIEVAEYRVTVESLEELRGVIA
jgi:hypothetical protein